jgi:DNA-binding GntR family transcriptional regulator
MSGDGASRGKRRTDPSVTEVVFEELRPLRKQDQVAAVLRRAILRGELEPGDRIVELLLARQLKVSQAPVREALATLAREGLVVRIAHRGSYVSRVNSRDLRELFSLRLLLDPYAARLAAERITDTEVAELRDLFEQMRSAARTGYLPGLTEAHVAFHERIYELTGHALMVDVFSLMRRRLTLALEFAESLYGDVEVEEHLPLLEALAARDPDRAERLAREFMAPWLDALPEDREASVSLRGGPRSPVEGDGRDSPPDSRPRPPSRARKKSTPR